MASDFQSGRFSNVRPIDIPGLVAGKFFGLPSAHLQYAYLSIASISNFWEVPLFVSKIRKSAEFRFRDGSVLKLNRAATRAPPRSLLLLKAGGHKVGYNEDFTTATFDFAGRQVKLSGAPESPLFFAYNLFLGKKEYPKIDVAGKTVVDVGANIGDTAIYFALLGAKKVVSFEPFADLVRQAEGNVRANSLGEKVEIVPAGVGAETKAIPLATGGGEHGAGSQIPAKEALAAHQVASPAKAPAGSIRIISLSDVVQKYGIDDAILKLDCEGSEYDIILKSDNALLRKFSSIVLEYHYGYVNLLKKLESAGFRVKICSGPKYDYNPAWAHPNIRIGILLAERKD